MPLTFNKDGHLSEASISDITDVIVKQKWHELANLYL